MSEFDLTATIEEFCSHATYVEEDGRSKLQDLLFKTQKSVASLLLDLLASKQYELTSTFLKKVNRNHAECVTFLQSEELDAVCASVAAVPDNDELKVNFIQLFLSSTPSNVCALCGIVAPAISWVASDSLELSDGCSKVLTLLAGFDIVMAEDVVTQIMKQVETVKDDSTKYLRYLCLLASFMKISSQYFLLCEAKGAAAIVIASCQHPDILMQTISLDFLVDLSSTPAGAEHLFQHRQVHWLVAMGGGEGGAEYLDASQGHAVEDFLLAQATSCAAKVLRNIEQQAPHLLYDYLIPSTPLPLATVLTQPSSTCSPLLSVFVSGLLKLLQHHEEAERLACLEGLVTYATSSPRAFLLLLSSERLLTCWLDLLRKQPSMQASTLHSVAQVLMYPAVLCPDPPPTPLVRAIHTLPSFSVLTAEQLTATLTEMDALKRKIFGQICLQLGTTRYESSMEFLVKLAKGPIGELKHAAYDVLRALAYQTGTWGVHTLFEFTGFFPFLLERATEHEKTGKDWKFALILALHHSPHIELLVDAIPQRIEALVKEGAYHTPREMAAPMVMEL